MTTLSYFSPCGVVGSFVAGTMDVSRVKFKEWNVEYHAAPVVAGAPAFVVGRDEGLAGRT